MEAAAVYTEALSAHPDWCAVLGNRSFAYLKVELYGLALADASRAIELDPTFTKVSCHPTFTKVRLEGKDWEES